MSGVQGHRMHVTSDVFLVVCLVLCAKVVGMPRLRAFGLNIWPNLLNIRKLAYALRLLQIHNEVSKGNVVDIFSLLT